MIKASVEILYHELYIINASIALLWSLLPIQPVKKKHFYRISNVKHCFKWEACLFESTNPCSFMMCSEILSLDSRAVVTWTEEKLSWEKVISQEELYSKEHPAYMSLSYAQLWKARFCAFVLSKIPVFVLSTMVNPPDQQHTNYYQIQITDMGMIELPGTMTIMFHISYYHCENCETLCLCIYLQETMMVIYVNPTTAVNIKEACHFQPTQPPPTLKQSEIKSEIISSTANVDRF